MIPLGNRQWFLSQEYLNEVEEINSELNRQKSSLAKLIKSAIKEGALNSGYPIEWIILSYDHMIHAAWEMIRNELATTQQTSDLAWNTFNNGLSHDQ